MSFRFSSLALTDTTNAQGVRTFSVPVPGTFGKLITSGEVKPNKVFGGTNKGKTEGRWLERIWVWSDGHVAGDRVTQIRLVDSKPAMPIGLAAKFPTYPVIYDFLERKGQETATLIHGLFIPPTGPMIYKPNDTPLFLPADLRLEIKVEAGVAVVGRRFRVNVYWGHLGVD